MVGAAFILFVLLGLMAFAAYAVSLRRLVVARQAEFDAWTSLEAVLDHRHKVVQQFLSILNDVVGKEDELLRRLATAAVLASRAEGSAALRAAPEADLTDVIAHVVRFGTQHTELDQREDFKLAVHDLTRVDARLDAARETYNAKVTEMRARRQSFPANVVAHRHEMPELSFFPRG